MTDQSEQAEMDDLMQQLEQWAEGEGDLPTDQWSQGVLTNKQKGELWALLSQPITSQHSLSHAGAALR